MRMLMVLVLFCAPISAQPVAVCGDCTGDDAIGIVDALIAAQSAAGLVPMYSPGVPTPQDLLRGCDVDSDGLLDIIDALLIALFAAGEPVTLACI